MSSLKSHKSSKALTIISTKSICPVRAEPKQEPETKPDASFAPKSFYSVPPKPKAVILSPEEVVSKAAKSAVRKPAAKGSAKLGRKKSAVKSSKTTKVEHSIRKPSKVKKETKKSPKPPKTEKSKT